MKQLHIYPGLLVLNYEVSVILTILMEVHIFNSVETFGCKEKEKLN